MIFQRQVLIAFYVLGLLVLSNAFAGDSVPWAERTQALGATGELPSGRLSKRSLAVLNDTGEALFSAPFTPEDGAGRPYATQAIIPTKSRRPREHVLFRTSGPDATACASCHNQPVLGGASDFVTNVFVSEGFNQADFDSIDPQFSNERGSNHLMGAGLIELLAREMSVELASVRTQALQKARNTQVEVRQALIAKDVSFGFITASPDGLVDLSEVDGVDADLVVRPFSQKGVMTSLRQFTVNAMNHHHGMQADERFGRHVTGSDDFDEDGYENELTSGDVSALVAWQAMLEPPRVDTPNDDAWVQAAARGSQAMSDYGCVECHRPALPLESLDFHDPGPLDVVGTLSSRDVAEPAIYDLALTDWAALLPRDENGRVLVPLFGDLKRHAMTDRKNNQLGNEQLSQRFVDRTRFMTAELWGVGSTAPYGHRNDFTSLIDVILAHGGDAAAASDAFAAADKDAQLDVVAYLKTLKIQPR